MEFSSVCPAPWLPDQNFKMCITPHDFISSFQDMQSSYYRPWKWYNQSISKGFGSTVENEKGNYKITLDVQYFRPNEIDVRVSDYEIIVEGKHEERPDIHGFVTRQFKRRYPLPNHCPPENVTSALSSDGVLTIIAEKKLSMNQTEKIVPIKLFGAFPQKTQIDTKITSEISHKAIKEEIKQDEAEEREDLRLLRPEILKENISETNVTCTKMENKQSIDIVKPSVKMDRLNISSNSNKIEESLENSITGLASLTEKFSEKSTVSEISGYESDLGTPYQKSNLGMSSMQRTADLSGIGSITKMSNAKNISESSDMVNVKNISGVQNIEEILGIKRLSEMSSMKSASAITGVKSALEMKEMKSESEIGGVKGLSKTLGEESSTSYMSSSSMLSSMSLSKNARECISDIREELREAAENV